MAISDGNFSRVLDLEVKPLKNSRREQQVVFKLEKPAVSVIELIDKYIDGVQSLLTKYLQSLELLDLDFDDQKNLKEQTKKLLNLQDVENSNIIRAKALHLYQGLVNWS